MHFFRRVGANLVVLTLLFMQATLVNGKIVDHEALQNALRDNDPPSGYIDLSHCKSEFVVGNLPQDKQTYSLSFKDHFSFNLESKIITSVFKTVLNSSQIINSVPVLVNVPATIFVTSTPSTKHLRYQITIENTDKQLIRVYQCPWKQAVYLWREGTKH